MCHPRTQLPNQGLTQRKNSGIREGHWENAYISQLYVQQTSSPTTQSTLPTCDELYAAPVPTPRRAGLQHDCSIRVVWCERCGAAEFGDAIRRAAGRLGRLSH